MISDRTQNSATICPSAFFVVVIDPALTPARTVAVDSIADPATKDALKTILTAFYKIALPLLPVDSHGNVPGEFRRSEIIDLFKSENDLNVCPLCDGDLNGAEIDHWLPEGKFPALSCFPKNLMPICHECNKPGRKHAKPPLSLGQPRPFDDWFHPYERPAVGTYSIIIENGKEVKLRNHDDQLQRRIDNLDKLIGLCDRWSEKYQQQIDDYLSQLKGKVKRRRVSVDEASLLKIVRVWDEELEDTRFERGHLILKKHILNSVSDSSKPHFGAWLQHMEDAAHG